MKKSFLIATLFSAILIGLSLTAKATNAPVINENAANNGIITIYQDHADPNHYYLAPNVVTIARGNDGRPIFSYVEFSRGLFETVGLIQMTLAPAYTRAELEAAEKDILSKNPKAIFSGVPFVKSELKMSEPLREIFQGTACNHLAGLIGQEQSCAFELTAKGRKMFLRAVKAKSLFTTLQFEYTIDAFFKKPDGGYGQNLYQFGIAARIHGEELSGYPELIQRK